MSFVSPVTNVIYTAVSWVLLRWHQLLTACGMNYDGGLTWALSIVLLVITARLLMFRFFIKQVHYQRHMQELQPQIQKLKDKHKGDRQKLQQEMMALQQEQGLNVLAGCLPMFLQIPVFLGLFHVLRHLANSSHASITSHQATLYGFSGRETLSAAHANLFGSAPLATSFHDSAAKVQALGGDLSTLRIVCIVLTVISAGATFITQRQVAKNATTAPVGQAAQIQKAMLYLIPVFVLGSGIFFPLGVLLYWFSSNLWTMCQQFYILKYHPHKPAEKTPALVSEVGRSRAPAPGVKPVRNRGAVAATAEAVVADDSPATVVRNAKPRPGSKPATSRPNNKSSGQRSKRR